MYIGGIFRQAGNLLVFPSGTTQYNHCRGSVIKDVPGTLGNLLNQRLKCFKGKQIINKGIIGPHIFQKICGALTSATEEYSSSA